MGTVVDRDGAVVGEALTTLNPPIASFIVRIDGGTFFYYGNGWLLPTEHRVLQGRRVCRYRL